MKRTPRTKRKYGPALYMKSRRLLAKSRSGRKYLEQVRDQHAKGLSPERKRVRKVSKTRAKQLREYAKLSKPWKERHTCCGWVLKYPQYAGRVLCKSGPHKCEDIHHMRGRASGLLLDTRFWLPVCRQLHLWIQNHPAEAKALGLIEGPWNHLPKEKAT